MLEKTLNLVVNDPGSSLLPSPITVRFLLASLNLSDPPLSYNERSPSPGEDYEEDRDYHCNTHNGSSIH